MEKTKNPEEPYFLVFDMPEEKERGLETIREDTVFIPYHWGGKHSANQLTIDNLDPVSRIPEFKVCACQLEKTGRKGSEHRTETAYQSWL